MSTTIQNVFKRNDAQVKEDALAMDFDAFKRKYESLAKDAVLKATWKDHRKSVQTAKQDEESTDLPEVVKEVKTTMSDGSILTNTTYANGTQAASVDNEPEAGDVKETKGTKKGTPPKKDKKEKAEKKEKAAPVQKADGTKTRAERMRELIAEGKDKAATKEILVGEGFDVTTIHSEWNRLTKKKD